MVGLSVILDNHKERSAKPSPHHQVISKGSCCSITKPLSHSPNGFSSSSSFSRRKPLPSFLDNCFLCTQKLSPAKDIYMYKGDKAFCSEECRCRQIFMDEDEASGCCSTSSGTPAKGGRTGEYSCSTGGTPSSSGPSCGGAGKRRSGSRRNAFAY